MFEKEMFSFVDAESKVVVVISSLFVVDESDDDNGVKNRITRRSFSSSISWFPQKGNTVMLEIVWRMFHLLLLWPFDDEETIFISLANLLKWMPKVEDDGVILLLSIETIS